MVTNEFKKVEAILYKYNSSKAKIRNLELDIENVKNEFNGPGSIRYEERTQSTNRFNSSVENEIISKEKKINELLKYKKQKEIEVLKVENSLNVLTERDQEIIKLRYFNKCNNREIAAKLNLAEEYISRLKKEAINRIIDFF
ncbi:sigma factor-like helix-turn-helix DNA-binding protein [Clostridium sp. HCS.1]|uniref:sigma factor-like helix-turn-helix DNA-binding protein n=1 Tax=Clostridium sp. HCS.1 TaxID=3238594 RepID=UPI003A0FE668